jgi:DNA repair exonuclease SbcCD ATPase subunit
MVHKSKIIDMWLDKINEIKEKKTSFDKALENWKKLKEFENKINCLHKLKDIYIELLQEERNICISLSKNDQDILLLKCIKEEHAKEKELLTHKDVLNMYDIEDNLIQYDKNMKQTKMMKFKEIIKYLVQKQEEESVVDKKNKINALESEWMQWKFYNYTHYKTELKIIDDEIELLKNHEAVMCEMNYWYNLTSVKKAFDTREENNKKYHCKKIEYESLKDNVERLTFNREKKKKKDETIKKLSHKNESLKKRKKSIEKLYEYFTKFRQWIYDEKILPKLCSLTNQILSVMKPRKIKLEGVFKADGKKEQNEKQISWYIHDEGNKINIEKASGYQRFIIGLALKISLTYIGASGIMCKQMFIDEGFTSCDKEHLKQIPEFINKLLRSYESILLMSHLEIIQDCVDETIEIKRTGSSKRTSQISYGEFLNINVKRKLGRKKKQDVIIKEEKECNLKL